MNEIVTLVFKDGTRFEWNTGKLSDGRRVLKLQKHHGDPTEIIGDGMIAQTLREKYAVYNKDPAAYKSDVRGSIKALGKNVTDEQIDKAKKMLGLNKEKGGE